MSPEISVTYFFDPLCGWCYGAAPALAILVEQADMSVTLAPTGLFAGELARPMDQKFADFAWSNDQRIARLTGQTFSEAYRQNVLGNHARWFDSTLPTLALTAVHITEPSREFEALKQIQLLRYVTGHDNTDLMRLKDMLFLLGLEEARMRFSSPDEDLKSMNQARIHSARSDMKEFGLNGVPALVVGIGGNHRAIPSNMLFGPPDALLAEIQREKTHFA